jgi:hypothetical protein
MKYCLIGRKTLQPLSYKGKVIVHGDKRELEYLFPNERVAPLPSYYDESLTMALKDHPDMDAVQFPLEQHMNQFRK